MSNLIQYGTYLYIFALVCIGLIGATIAGFAFWIGINKLIDKFQGSQRRPMATSMTAQALREKRQSDAAARRLQIRVIDGWARK